MTLQKLLEVLSKKPETIEFDNVIKVIDERYNFTPTQFHNGTVVNQAGENSGSCRLLAFAQLHQLSQQQTLHCFGQYYRVDVLLHPGQDNHQNIRQFMQTGWSGVRFEAPPLIEKI